MPRWNSDQIRREVLELANSGKYKSAKKLAKDTGHASQTVHMILKQEGILLCKRGKFNEPRILELIKSGEYTNAKEIAKMMNISTMPVYRVLRKHKLSLPKKYARLTKKDQLFELHRKGYSINHICKALSMVSKDVLIVLNESGLKDIPQPTIKPFRYRSNIKPNRNGRNNLPAELSAFVKSSIIGSILGDLGLRLNGSITSNASGQVVHGGPQYEYFMHKVDIWSDLITRYEGQYVMDPRTKKKYLSLRANLRADPFLKEIYHWVYIDRGKEITETILKHFDDIALAYLFMDDGSRISTRSRLIATNSFSLKGNELMREYLHNNYKLNTYMNNQNQIVIEEGCKFDEIVRPYIIPSMEYKISI